MAGASGGSDLYQNATWELSKENVEPVKSGRDVNRIKAVLEPSEEDMERLMREKQQFEEEIIAGENSNDPIAPWDRYLEWTIQNFPTGRNKKTLTSLLSKFVEKFKGGCYNNDTRYVNAWLKLAGIVDEPLEIYSFMNTEGIGNICAEFYVAWADEYEKYGDTQKADRVYNDGEKKGAEPFSLLQKRHFEFQLRIARGVLQDDDKDQDECKQRGTLSQLDGRGKHGFVGSVRNGTAFRPLQNKGWSQVSNSRTSKQSSNFEIFQDDSENASLMGQSGKWTSIPSNAASKENVQEAGPWNSGMNAVHRRSRPAVAQLSDFQIYEDADAGNESSQQSRVLPKIERVLSDKKETQLDISQIKSAIHEMPIHDGKAKSYYDVDKVYTVLGEMQFEEVRAAFWRKKQRLVAEQQNQLQRIQLEEKKARLREQEQLKIQEEEKLIEESLRKVALERKMMEAERVSLNQRNISMEVRLRKVRALGKLAKTAEEAEILQKEEEDLTVQLNAMRGKLQKAPIELQRESQSSMEQHSTAVNYNNNPPSNNLATASDFEIFDENAELDKTNDEMKALTASANTKQALSSNSSLNHSKRSQPSPTVYTKEAMSQLNAWFQKSFDSEFDDSCKDFRPTEEPSQPVVSVVQENMEINENQESFVIFDEEKEDSVAQDNPSLSRKGLSARPFAPLRDGKTMVAIAQKEPQSHIYNETDLHFDDVTVAGSHFAAKARMASTPASSKANKLQDSTQIKYLSCIQSDFHTTNDCPQEEDVSNKQTGDEARHYFSDANIIQFQTVDNAATTKPSDEDKQLSPIMEDSKESEKSSVAMLKSSSDDAGSGTYMKNESGQVANPGLMEKIQVDDLVSTNVANSPSTLKNSTSFCEDLDMNDSFDCNLWGSNSPDSADQKVEEMPKSDSLHERQCLSNQVEMGDIKVSDLCSEVDSMSFKEQQPTSRLANVISDPWNDSLLNSILEGEKAFLNDCGSPIIYYSQKLHVRLTPGSCLDIQGNLYRIGKVIGEGAYAKIYDVNSPQTERQVLKAQSPPCLWEMYAVATARQRLRNKGLNDIADAIVVIYSAHIYNDCSLLFMPCFPRGTLLDAINFKKGRELPKDKVAIWIAYEIVKIVHGLHSIGIIHGDIKPDNIMVVAMDSKRKCKTGIKLIDFGRSIDMEKLPENVAFTRNCGTSAFSCIQMQNNQPWNYHTDFYGIAGTLHVLLFASYMNVEQSEEGIWKITSKVKRWRNASFWNDFFNTLLNFATPTDAKPITLKDSPLPRLMENIAESLNKFSSVTDDVDSFFRDF